MKKTCNDDHLRWTQSVPQTQHASSNSSHFPSEYLITSTSAPFKPHKKKKKNCKLHSIYLPPPKPPPKPLPPNRLGSLHFHRRMEGLRRLRGAPQAPLQRRGEFVGAAAEERRAVLVVWSPPETGKLAKKKEIKKVLRVDEVNV